jgi:flagellar basal-body rod modification protein FlgD
MATTDSVGGSTAADALTGSATNTTRTANSSLGKDDFLKLLVGQMKNMDPLSEGGSDPSQSMAQMTQYSILEQLQNLSAATKQSSTFGLIGHTVTYTEKDASETGNGVVKNVEGVVESVQNIGGKLTLTVGGKGGIDPESVLQVS